MEGKEELVEETLFCYTSILVCPLVTLFTLLEVSPFYYFLSPASYLSYHIWFYFTHPSVMKHHQFIYSAELSTIYHVTGTVFGAGEAN